MVSTDLFRASEVRDRPRDAQNAVKAAGRQTHDRRGIRKQLAAELIGRRDPVEKLTIGLRIGARPMPVVTIGLDQPRGGHAARDVGAALGRRRQGQVGGRNTRYLDVQIDPVEQRP